MDFIRVWLVVSVAMMLLVVWLFGSAVQERFGWRVSPAVRRRVRLVVSAVLLVLIGWLGGSEFQAKRIERELQRHIYLQVRFASSAIYDANWALQRVDDPTTEESMMLIRSAWKDLIVARESLQNMPPSRIEVPGPREEIAYVEQLVHVISLGLEAHLDHSENADFYGDRRMLDLLNDHLAFPQSDPSMERFRTGIAEVRAIHHREGFKVTDLPPVPPMMQLVIGSYAPVRRGGGCWSEAGRQHCVDPADPEALLNGVSAQPVRPGSQGELKFARDPNPGSVRLWHLLADGSREPVALTPELGFTLPQESGTHLFVAEAEWEQGNGLYVFKTLVE